MQRTFKLFFLGLTLAFITPAKAQEAPLKHKYAAYFHWGYNRSSYTESDLHMQGGDEFDFTVYNIKAKDVPEKYSSKIYLNPGFLTIPQFNFRFGVIVDDKWSFSGGWDHLKYRLVSGQTVGIEGTIGATGGEYAGSYADGSTIVLNKNLLRMEHTDGLNFIHFNVDRHFKALENKKKWFRTELVVGAGTGPVCPWTDTHLFNNFYRNPTIHFAGWGVSVNASARFVFLKRFFVEHMFRVGHVKLWDIMIIRDKYTAETKINYFERNITAGFIFPLNPSKNGSNQSTLEPTN